MLFLYYHFMCITQSKVNENRSVRKTFDSQICFTNIKKMWKKLKNSPVYRYLHTFKNIPFFKSLEFTWYLEYLAAESICWRNSFHAWESSWQNLGGETCASNLRLINMGNINPVRWYLYSYKLKFMSKEALCWRKEITKSKLWNIFEFKI